MPEIAPAAVDPASLPVILIVDDEPANLGVLSRVLQPHYRVRAARSGKEALRIAQTDPKPDLVLLDIMMPEMDGYGVLAALKSLPEGRDLPVIFVTALSDELSEERGLEQGAVDFLTKPIQPSIVHARIRLHLELKAARVALANQNAALEAKVEERTESLKKALETTQTAQAALKKTYFGTLLAISAVTQLRGAGIGEHCRRVAEHSRQIAKQLALPESQIQEIFVAGLLHDVGMIGYPDDLLRLPVQAMSPEQLMIYQGHPQAGAAALRRIDSLAPVADIINDHHEHFDGRGFPRGKSGLEIPLGARIIAAVSDFDDLLHGKRTGKPLSTKESFEYILAGRGYRYDPRVVDFLETSIASDLKDVVIEIRVSPAHLQTGMILTRDVMHPDGFLLLSKDSQVTQVLIDQLLVVDRELSDKLQIYVKRNQNALNAQHSDS